MSRFLSDVIKKITPYTPGEQTKDTDYIKLNTNECAFPPSPKVAECLEEFESGRLKLYPDPTLSEVKKTAADYYDISGDQVFVGCGSDEVLAYAFMAFFNKDDSAYFPDITYGFYKVYAELYQLNKKEVPLDENYRVNPEDYYNKDGNIVIANPNAPTGICLDIDTIEGIIKENPDRVVIIDEAYIDFSSQKSAVSLIDKYDNLLVVQTFSKSRGLAGMRLGLGFGSAELMDGLRRVKFSINPYNVDMVAQKVAVASLLDGEYMKKVLGDIVKTRQSTKKQLEALGFAILDSETNFLLVKPPNISGEDYYNSLKDSGVLVRYFDSARLKSFVRVSIGTDAEMKIFIEKTKEILG